jgi:hypothetical protein
VETFRQRAIEDMRWTVDNMEKVGTHFSRTALKVNGRQDFSFFSDVWYSEEHFFILLVLYMSATANFEPAT